MPTEKSRHKIKMEIISFVAFTLLPFVVSMGQKSQDIIASFPWVSFGIP
jgi:hypothetical protein